MMSSGQVINQGEIDSREGEPMIILLLAQKPDGGALSRDIFCREVLGDFVLEHAGVVPTNTDFLNDREAVLEFSQDTDVEQIATDLKGLEELGGQRVRMVVSAKLYSQGRAYVEIKREQSFLSVPESVQDPGNIPTPNGAGFPQLSNVNGQIEGLTPEIIQRLRLLGEITDTGSSLFGFRGTERLSLKVPHLSLIHI